ncbi:MAG: Xaa-Pro peptidase family protein [Butyrivibrio sp.]|nr:Xaa-Pro peptidase family protein [Butyrivibrio sp.]
MVNTNRVKRILDKLSGMDLDQLLICDPTAIFYLTGKWIFPGERFLALILKKDSKPVFIMSKLFEFAEDIGAEKVYFDDTDDIIPIVANHIDERKHLGVDKNLAAKFLLPMMEARIACGFLNASVSVDMTRSVKDEIEQEKMRQASLVNDKAMEQFKTLVRDDITELEVAEQMLGIYKSFGASGYSFEPIVAFGANAADPHHMPDNTALKEGDTVLFDVGCVLDDYCSDMTRTFFYKTEPSGEARDVYELVKRANQEAEDMLKPGIPLCEVDKKARDIISEAGYGPNFTHRLGHFIGVETHEFGDVSALNKNLTEVGNTFSIEPGVYVPGGIGVRIEDLVLITENGREVLNHYSKEIEVIG